MKTHSEMNGKVTDKVIPIHIRHMHEDDLAVVMEIDRLSFSLPWSKSAYEYELHENPNSRLWVAETSLAESAPCVVGMSVVWLILDEAHIATLAIHPNFRGQGIAKRILIDSLQQAIWDGATLATLEVRANNLAAQQLYTHFGFDIVGRRPRYYRDNNEDALIMTIDKLGNDYVTWLESQAYLYKMKEAKQLEAGEFNESR